MSNEERMLSMLDLIASELQEVKTKVNTLDQKVDTVAQRVTSIEENMVTKDDLHKTIVESQEDIKAMLRIISNKLDEQDSKFGVVNDRLFSQEVQIKHIVKREVR